MATPTPVLDPSLTLLARRDGTVQVGWDPERAYLVHPPEGVAPPTMIRALRLLDGRRSVANMLWQAADLGIDAGHMRAVMDELLARGSAAPPAPAPTRRPVFAIVGRGPLSDRLRVALAEFGEVNVHRAALPRRHTEHDLVVLADLAVAEPTVVAELTRSVTAHLAVRCRDGRGVVGPLVMVGRTSCLRCADLTRCDYDPEWPYLSAQMLGYVGTADRVTLALTTTVAAGQVRDFLAHRRDGNRPAPAAVGRSIEIDGASASVRHRRWPVHPLCPCSSTGSGQDRPRTGVGGG